MKLLTFSDAHLDCSTAGMRRIDDLAGAFGKIASLAVERKVDAVVFKGDLADPDAGSILIRVLDTTIQLATRLNGSLIDFFLVAGNHDTIEDGSGLTTLHPLRHIPGVRVFEQPRAIEYRGCHIGFLPYPSRVTRYDPEQAIDDFFEGAGSRRIVIGHCTDVPGVRAGSESADLARGGSLRFPLERCKANGVEFMANGHFHHQQVTPDGIHIAGSLERLRFDEEHHTPGILIVDIGPKTA